MMITELVNMVQKKAEIGKKIVESVQKHLAERYPYMLLAVYSLTPLYDPMEKSLSTDGRYVFFSPDYLIPLYKDKRKRVQMEKRYMHILMHCILGHVTDRAGKNETAYDAMVDLNVAIVMSGFPDKGIRTTTKFMSSDKTERLRERWKDKLTAERYGDMMSDSHVGKLVESMSQLVVQDDHTHWNHINSVAEKEEQKKGRSGNRKQGKEKKQGDGGDSSAEKKNMDYREEIREHWKNICGMMLSQGMLESDKWMYGVMKGSLLAQETEVYGMSKENHCSYREFLQRFTENMEVMKLDEDSFDYIWYHIGTQWYDNMPILEPLEYKEDRICDNIVIAIDTSGSCEGDVARRFLRETFTLFRDMSVSGRQFQVYLMQCDMEITYEQELRTEEDIPDFENMELKGFGGTNFCPVFERIEQLQDGGKLQKVKGLIYFSDGFGTFPKKVPDYETVFVLPPIYEKYGFLDDSQQTIPSWVTKVQLTEDDLSYSN